MPTESPCNEDIFFVFHLLRSIAAIGADKGSNIVYRPHLHHGRFKLVTRLPTWSDAGVEEALIKHHDRLRLIAQGAPYELSALDFLHRALHQQHPHDRSQVLRMMAVGR